jgi:succinate-semialdehyde dehydrogenase/glutarate-semialdehyde dehydrogenase
MKADEFMLFANKINLLKQGDPMMEGIMGASCSIGFSRKIRKSITKNQQQGAKIIVGGARENCNFQPTLIECFDSNSIAFQEETFGPLATVIREDENQAIKQ